MVSWAARSAISIKPLLSKTWMNTSHKVCRKLIHYSIVSLIHPTVSARHGSRPQFVSRLVPFGHQRLMWWRNEIVNVGFLANAVLLTVFRANLSGVYLTYLSSFSWGDIPWRPPWSVKGGTCSCQSDGPFSHMEPLKVKEGLKYSSCLTKGSAGNDWAGLEHAGHFDGNPKLLRTLCFQMSPVFKGGGGGGWREVGMVVRKRCVCVCVCLSGRETLPTP